MFSTRVSRFAHRPQSKCDNHLTWGSPVQDISSMVTVPYAQTLDTLMSPVTSQVVCSWCVSASMVKVYGEMATSAPSGDPCTAATHKLVTSLHIAIC